MATPEVIFNYVSTCRLEQRDRAKGLRVLLSGTVDSFDARLSSVLSSIDDLYNLPSDLARFDSIWLCRGVLDELQEGVALTQVQIIRLLSLSGVNVNWLRVRAQRLTALMPLLMAAANIAVAPICSPEAVREAHNDLNKIEVDHHEEIRRIVAGASAPEPALVPPSEPVAPVAKRPKPDDGEVVTFLRSEGFAKNIGAECCICLSFPADMGVVQTVCCGALMCGTCVLKRIEHHFQSDAGALALDMNDPKFAESESNSRGRWFKSRNGSKHLVCPNGCNPGHMKIRPADLSFCGLRAALGYVQNGEFGVPVALKCVADSNHTHGSDAEWARCFQHAPVCARCPVRNHSDEPCSGFKFSIKVFFTHPDLIEATLLPLMNTHVEDDCTAHTECPACKSYFIQKPDMSWLVSVRRLEEHRRQHICVAALFRAMCAGRLIKLSNTDFQPSPDKHAELWYKQLQSLVFYGDELWSPGKKDVLKRLHSNKSPPRKGNLWRTWITSFETRLCDAGPAMCIAAAYPMLLVCFPQQSDSAPRAVEVIPVDDDGDSDSS
jgi:hypothetical protein